MYSFELNKHPQVLMREGPSENGENGNKDKSLDISFDSFIDEVFGKLKNGEDAKETIKKYGSQLSQGTKNTLQFFIDSGQFDLANKLSWSALKSFATRSIGGDFTGGSRIDAMKECLKKSQISNTQHILVLSNGYWSSVDKKQYVQNVSTDISHLNANVLQDSIKSGQFKTFFSEETQGDIALYLQGRNYNSRLIGKDGDIKNIMEPLAKKKKEEEIKKIDPMINQIQKQFSGSPEVMKGVQILSNNIGVTLDASGKIDIDSILQDFFREQKEGKNEQAIMNHLKITINGIENKMKIIRAEILSERTQILTKIGGENTNPSNFPELTKLSLTVKDSNGKTVDMKDTPFKSLSKDQARTILSQISQLDQTKMSPKLAQLIIFLGLQVKLSNVEGIMADTTQIKKSIQKGEISIKKGENGKAVILEIEKSKERRNTAILFAEQSRNLRDTQEILKQNNITNLSLAQDELSSIISQEKNGELLSQEKKTRKALLEQYIRINGTIAVTYKNAINTLGKQEAQEVFSDSYKTISNNPKEIYDFNALEKIAILTDPESTPSEKKLARLEPGESISAEKLMEGEMHCSISSAPEISSTNIFMNQNGTYNIPLLKENNLSKPQVQECLVDIGLYADLGLSQFIPHIPLITEELKNKGINTKIDGKTGTMEQQRCLKAMYSLLYGKNIETTNLYDVERAFASSAGNPTNMKNAMQHTLSVHHLIASPGQAIAPDTLQNWIRGNLDFSSPSINPTATT